MVATVINGISRALKWITRCIVLLVTIFFLFFYTLFALGPTLSYGGITADILPPVVFGLMVLAGFILSWRREGIAGILFITTSVGVTVAGIVNTWLHLPDGWTMSKVVPTLVGGWLQLGLPLLLTGILLVVVSRLNRLDRSRSEMQHGPGQVQRGHKVRNWVLAACCVALISVTALTVYHLRRDFSSDPVKWSFVSGDGVWDGNARKWKVQLKPGETRSATIELHNTSQDNKVILLVMVSSDYIGLDLQSPSIVLGDNGVGVPAGKSAQMEISAIASQGTPGGTYTVDMGYSTTEPWLGSIPRLVP